MKHSPPLESDSCMADKKKSSQPMDPILTHLYPFGNLTSYLNTVINIAYSGALLIVSRCSIFFLTRLVHLRKTRWFSEDVQ